MEKSNIRLYVADLFDEKRQADATAKRGFRTICCNQRAGFASSDVELRAYCRLLDFVRELNAGANPTTTGHYCVDDSTTVVSKALGYDKQRGCYYVAPSFSASLWRDMCEFESALQARSTDQRIPGAAFGVEFRRF